MRSVADRVRTTDVGDRHGSFARGLAVSLHSLHVPIRWRPHRLMSRSRSGMLIEVAWPDVCRHRPVRAATSSRDRRQVASRRIHTADGAISTHSQHQSLSICPSTGEGLRADTKVFISRWLSTAPSLPSVSETSSRSREDPGNAYGVGQRRGTHLAGERSRC